MILPDLVFPGQTVQLNGEEKSFIKPPPDGAVDAAVASGGDDGKVRKIGGNRKRRSRRRPEPDVHQSSATGTRVITSFPS